MFVSGQSSEQSFAQYSSRPSVLQLEIVSDTISNALENQLPEFDSKQISTRGSQTATNAPVIERMNHMANVSISTANASFRNGIFSSCNIQGNVQVFFGLPTRSEDKNDLTLLSLLYSWISNREWFS